MTTGYKGFAPGDQVELVLPADVMIDGYRERIPVGTHAKVVRIQAWASKPAATKHRKYLVLEVTHCREVMTVGVHVEQVKKVGKSRLAA